MAFWTRLRPGKNPGYNRALCNFYRRALDLRLSREIAIALRNPIAACLPVNVLIVKKAQKQGQWEFPHEPPF